MDPPGREPGGSFHVLTVMLPSTLRLGGSQWFQDGRCCMMYSGSGAPPTVAVISPATHGLSGHAVVAAACRATVASASASSVHRAVSEEWTRWQAHCLCVVELQRGMRANEQLSLPQNWVPSALPRALHRARCCTCVSVWH